MKREKDHALIRVWLMEHCFFGGKKEKNND
jgi:hypothetical protein